MRILTLHNCHERKQMMKGTSGAQSRIPCRPDGSPARCSLRCLSPHRHQRGPVHPADGDEAQQVLAEREGSHVTAAAAPQLGLPGSPLEGVKSPSWAGFPAPHFWLPLLPPAAPQQSVCSQCEKKRGMQIWNLAGCCHGDSPSVAGQLLAGP